MSIDDKENLYILEEEDDSPKNFAQYSDEEREEEPEKVSHVRKSPFGILLYIMFSPVEGWKTLRRKNISVEMLQSSCFYPILAILAISKFADYFYSVNITLSSLVTEAVVAFVAYFLGFFCIQMMLAWFLPKEVHEKFDCNFGKEYIIIGLSSLALFNIITNLLPMLWPILIFLPLWTLYILFKGIKFFKFEQFREMRFYITAAIGIIGLPLVIEWGLNEILPY